MLRPCVLLPDWLPEYLTASQLCDVLLHEVAHLRRRDAWVGLLQRLAEILFWPHPLVYYLNRQLCRVREEMCDNHVLRHRDARAYAHTLLKLAERCAPAGRPFAAIALMSPHWKLEDRVSELLDTRRNLMTRTNPRLFAAVAAAFLCAGVLLASIRFGPEAHSAPPAPPSEKEREPAADSETVDISKVDVSRAVIEGTVVDEAGQPVAGAVVSTLDQIGGLAEEIKPVRTSQKGTFRLVLAEPSVRYQAVVARTDGGAKQGIGSLSDVGTPLEGKAILRLVLKPSRALAVRVREDRGTAVPGATVGVFDDEYHLLTSTETDAGGRADFRLPRDAHIFQVVALKPGAGFDYFENYHSWPGRELDTLPAKVALTLDGARTVQVRATDSTGKALSGIALQPWTIHKKGKLGYVNFGGNLKHVQARTDKLGVASFEWLPRQLGDRAVTFLCAERSYHLPDAPAFLPSKPDAPLVARLFSNVPIRGKVTLPDGKPAGGILLQAEGRGNTNFYCRQLARTRADGTYSLLVYADQSYLIAVTDEQWAAPSKTGLIARGPDLRGHRFPPEQRDADPGQVHGRTRQQARRRADDHADPTRERTPRRPQRPMGGPREKRGPGSLGGDRQTRPLFDSRRSGRI